MIKGALVKATCYNGWAGFSSESVVDDLWRRMEEFQGKIKEQVSVISTTLQIGLTV